MIETPKLNAVCSKMLSAFLGRRERPCTRANLSPHSSQWCGLSPGMYVLQLHDDGGRDRCSEKSSERSRHSSMFLDRITMRPMMDVKIAFAEKTLAAVIAADGFLVRVRCGDGG